jgi:hypothetical protein
MLSHITGCNHCGNRALTQRDSRKAVTNGQHFRGNCNGDGVVIRIFVVDLSAICALHRNLEKNSLHQHLGKLSGKYILSSCTRNDRNFILYSTTTEVANAPFEQVTKG